MAGLTGVFLAVFLALRNPPSKGVALEDGDFGAVPEFRLTERSGRTVSAADLKGKVWVADFIFTRCMGPCPRLSRAMAGLQSSLAAAPDARLVSITVDPSHDTPAALAAYAERFEADKERWLFLTGDPAAVRDLVLGGFKAAMQDNPSAGPGEAVTHSLGMALVDKDGRIRGYFDGSDPAALERLAKRAKALL
jgi:cytochrome oxidase Cu insertion factor (SCO1/SenC/PrrC family)